MNPKRVFAIAANVFKETIRDRVLYVILFFAVILLLGTRFLPEVAAGSSVKLILDAGLATISLFGLVVAVFVGTNLINKEIEKRTIFVLIAKPLKRSELLLGKHLGLGAVLAVLVGLMFLAFLLAIFVVIQVDPGFVPIQSMVTAVALNYLELLVIIAAALFFGTFTSSLMASVFTFSLYLIGHFSRDLLALGAIAKNENIAMLTRVVYTLLPDLERFNIRNESIYGSIPSLTELGVTLSLGILYIALFMSGAVTIFSRREF
jgi:Cu-processing system permease protein